MIARDGLSARWSFVARVLVKAALLFVVANAVYAVFDPLNTLGRLSIYNRLVPGRERLPYGENPALAYNLTLTNVAAMVESHRLEAPKAPNEFRVLLLGDSSVWGFLLPPGDTLSAALNDLGLTARDGRRMRFYNLGYPEMSLMKDLVLLDAALAAEPDLVLWLLTLESFAPERQLSPQLIRANPERVLPLVRTFRLDLSGELPAEPPPLERTLVARRRELADWLRLQLYGVAWAATGIDQHIPDSYTPRSNDLEPETTWHGITEAEGLDMDDIAFAVMDAGVQRAREVPVVLVNEPMFVASGRNSDLRYNFFYPRWTYDRYRELLHTQADWRDFTLVDLWDRIPPEEYTDSPVHLTPEGERQRAALLVETALAPYLADASGQE